MSRCRLRMISTPRIGTTVKGMPVEIVSIAELGIDLRHLAKYRLPGLLFELNWNLAHVEIQHNLPHSCRPAQLKCGSQRRMTGERQLFLYREDSHPHPTFAFDRRSTRQDERGLGKIHLPRQRLHFFVAQPSAISKNRYGIALKTLRGEHVQLHEGKPPKFRCHVDNCSA